MNTARKQTGPSEVVLVVKHLPANARDMGDAGLIPGLGRSSGGDGNPLQYSCLENPLDRGAWWATVHGAAKSWTCRKQLSMYKQKKPAKTNPGNIGNFPFTIQFQLSNLEETTVKVCCIQILKN